MIIETDVVENALKRAPESVQDKIRIVLRILFQEAVDLREAETILAVVDKVIKKAAKKIDTKEFKKKIP